MGDDSVVGFIALWLVEGSDVITCAAPVCAHSSTGLVTFIGERIVSIVENKKAFHDYHIEDRLEAGLVLEGWEVKAIRAGRAQIKEAYVVIIQGELFLIGAHISPLTAASTHVNPDPVRTRKLLLHEREIGRLIGQVERAGYALVPLNLHFTRGRIKLDMALAKGKKQYDKREAEKRKDWQREKSRLMASASRRDL
jgi:SsrA-binding protein